MRLSIGDIIGKKILLRNLPWTPTQDPSEQLPPQRSHFDPSPLPPRNNVTIYTFLGVPYAEPPVAQRRLKVSGVIVLFCPYTVILELHLESVSKGRDHCVNHPLSALLWVPLCWFTDSSCCFLVFLLWILKIFFLF